MSIVTQKAIIREMDVPELFEYLHQLGTAQDCNSHETCAYFIQQAQEACTQYRQLTGQPLSPHNPGLSVVAAAMVHAVSQPEIMETL